MERFGRYLLDVMGDPEGRAWTLESTDDALYLRHRRGAGVTIDRREARWTVYGDTITGPQAEGTIPPRRIGSGYKLARDILEALRTYAPDTVRPERPEPYWHLAAIARLLDAVPDDHPVRQTFNEPDFYEVAEGLDLFREWHGADEDGHLPPHRVTESGPQRWDAATETWVAVEVRPRDLGKPARDLVIDWTKGRPV